MKISTLISSVAIGLVALNAGADTGSNLLNNSFDNDLNRQATPTAHYQVQDTDPLHELVNVALWQQDKDQVMASFDRDLNREVTPTANDQGQDTDPLHELVNVALWQQDTDQVVASFDRDLNRIETPTAKHQKEEMYPLHALVDAVLWNSDHITENIAQGTDMSTLSTIN